MQPLEKLDLPGVINVVVGDAVNQGREAEFAARGEFRQALDGNAATAWRKSRCSSSSRAVNPFHWLSLRLDGTANQLLPFNRNEPRFSPVSRRRTAYFQ